MPVPASKIEPEKPQNEHSTSRHVLIVDDSRLQRKILSSSVKRWGFRVTEADSGDKALELCRESTPDIILSDWMMPGMNGLEFCDAFRRLPGESYGYFILLTSKSEKGEVAQGLQAGADDFLTKPVNAHELRARISAGERILDMQHELTEKNRLISDTLAELQRVYDSLDSDLLEAKKLQQSLVRERQKTFDTAELSLMLRSSGHVGGDLVGFFPGQPGHLGLYAIDVSGHGISSALMTARLAGYLSATAPDQNVALRRQSDGSFKFRKPSCVIEDLNNLVLDEMDTEHYFTLMLADVNLETGHMLVSQAGHPHPAVQRRDGTVEQNGTGGFPVGLMSGITFEDFEIQLKPGDRVLMLSDGVTECPNQEGDMLEESGLEKMMNNMKDMSGQKFFDAMMWNLGAFSGLDEFPDDISGILFEYSGHKIP
ncbi:Transcriptional regulatory protein AfsQ1 [Ascidiaceihabitans donghaensis]|uniref:Transcriptional regulatory protein AfsQ1 n=1 Tax=Ascidiaceihabitans donghaensis TaxID=1510460 RepID=A0A2R8B8M7_9RHOB|nr:SpoIIE family protein phosphatase [Ascidiaceihabitans donghaensis]SPH19425.1 Transcriptional regulatory protein AfsQ1 [Ascidiaceihabitans donghaensis]